MRESSLWPSERPAAVLLGFWALLSKPPHGGPGGDWGGSRTPRGTPATHYPARLRTTPQVCQIASVPHHRGMLTSRVEWLGTEVVSACVSSFHGPMDEFRRSRTVRSCSALCWPNSGGYSRRNRTSPRCLLCICAVCLVNCEAAARSILTR